MRLIFCQRIASLTLSGLALLATAGALRAAEIKDLRVWASPESTRVVLDLSGAVDYKLFPLTGPDRLVLDLQASTLSSGFRLQDVAKGALRQVRTGKQGDRDLRIVLDLNETARPKSFLLPPAEGHGHRLVIDLPTAAATAPTVTRTVQQAVPAVDRDVIIAIDAGHGGEDPGAMGPGGSREKNITLAVARELARQINAERGFRAVMIRDGDYFIPLEQRYRRARDAQADLFVSIHADAFHRQTASGSSVYVLSTRGATNEASRWLAARENASDLVGGVKLDDKDDTLAAVLLNLAQSATMKASDDVANYVLSAMKRVGKTHKPDVERANFVVLRSPDVPSMLIETAFISNPGEERKLNDPAHRQRLAAAIVNGVKDYFNLQPPPGSWLASNARPRARQHIVSRGETLSHIASQHGISLSALRSANRLRGDVVKVGDRLQIPGA